MEVTDYGLWISYSKPVENDGPEHITLPVTDEMKLSDFPHDFRFVSNGSKVCLVLRPLPNNTVFYFKSPDFISLSRQFTFKEDLSNQPLLKLLKRAIKRYKAAIKASPALEKSKYVKSLDVILEGLCL